MTSSGRGAWLMLAVLTASACLVSRVDDGGVEAADESRGLIRARLRLRDGCAAFHRPVVARCATHKGCLNGLTQKCEA